MKQSAQKSMQIAQLIKDYIKLDKSFRLKHDALKTLYQAYLELYKKYKNTGVNNQNMTLVSNFDITTATDSKHTEMIHNIRNEMKDNNTNLYRERLLILKRIRETPDLCPVKKEKICGKLLAIFKSPPITDYKPIELEQVDMPPIYNAPSNLNNLNNINNRSTDYIRSIPTLDLNKSNTINSIVQDSNPDKKISVNELDHAYFQKHNELMTVYKAYKNLFQKTLGYKDDLDEYKKLNTGSSITNGQMNKLMDDQKFVMNMIDKMQDELIDRKIINTSEKIPVAPVANNPQNITFFNNTARDQIKHIIQRDIDITPEAKTSIARILTGLDKSQGANGRTDECNSNEQFCQSGKKVIILGKRYH